MSPGAPPSLVNVSRLLQALAIDTAAMTRWETELTEIFSSWPAHQLRREMLSHVAVALHAWYSALENALDRSAHAIDGEAPHGSQSHLELLLQLMTEIPDLRPAVLPRTLEEPLRELLKFRHFFRHAYVVDLDPSKLENNSRTLLEIAPAVGSALRSWGEFLERTSAALRSTP